MRTKFMLLMLLMLYFAALHASPAFAQSESYVDTIYQAIDAAVLEEENAAAAYPEATWATEAVVITDNSSATVEIATDTAELQRVTDLIDSMTRILLGKLGGVNLGFKIIDCVKILPPTETATGTATITDTSTSTSTATGTATVTSTATATSTITATSTATVTNTSTATTTATSTATVTNTSTATTTATSTATVTNTSTATTTATSTATVTSTSTGTTTSTTTGTSTSTTTSTTTSTSTSTSTSTGTGTGDPIDDQKAIMTSKYGIEAANGTSPWSESQLKLANELLATLPKNYRNATDVILRDKEPPEGAPEGVIGYVSFCERRVHMLDAGTKLSQAMIDSMTETLGRAPTSEEQLVQIRFQFKKTLAHEMAHCFQNTYPEVYRNWQAQFWPGDKIIGSCPSAYGKTKPYEDMADSVALYIMGGRIENGFFVTAYGTKMDMDRYNFIKNNVLGGTEYLKPPVATGTASI
ncbi:MAG TPA: hypothetical protein PLM07_12995 [Candidatus Rifleibacterium sp.]|nr:hypothetical protein [Candidatus Rifleibacterium sp.]